MKSIESLSVLGARQAVLVGLDGLVIEAVGKKIPEPEILGAELANVMRLGQRLADSLDGQITRFTIATDDREILSVIFGEYCIGAIVERGSDRKGIGTELSSLAATLAEQL